MENNNLETASSSTLQDNNTLSPEVWNKEGDSFVMKEEIRERLLEISQDFYEFLKVPIKLLDITLTGSLSNYNYSKFSDFDLHLIINYDDIDADHELVEDFFNMKKTIWNNEHDISILDSEDTRKTRLTLKQINSMRLASEAHDAKQKEEAVFVQKMYGQPAQGDNLEL